MSALLGFRVIYERLVVFLLVAEVGRFGICGGCLISFVVDNRVVDFALNQIGVLSV